MLRHMSTRGRDPRGLRDWRGPRSRCIECARRQRPNDRSPGMCDWCSQGKRRRREAADLSFREQRREVGLP